MRPEQFTALIGLGIVLSAVFLTSIRTGTGQTGDGEERAGEMLLPVGVARVDITPGEPIRLSGYGSRKTPSEGVAGRLFAKALAMGGDSGELTVLVTLDAIGIPGPVTRELARRLEEKAGLGRAHLAVAATHTHAAPALAGNIPFMFPSGLTEEESGVIRQYTDRLLGQLEKVALEAVANRSPARVDWGKGEVGFAVNRRVLKDGKWTGFGVREDGPVDHSLPVMRITDPDGELRAVFASYACHCTTLGGKFNEIHGDWAGVAQQEIERRHPGAIAMIAIGCGADQNPGPRGELAMAENHGRSVADEVDRLLGGGELLPVGSVPSCRYREIELPLDAPPSREVWEKQVAEGSRGSHFARAMLERLERGEPLEDKVIYPVQCWNFGSDLAMVFLAGEVVVDYALRFYREFDRDRLWINAYSNDVPCYIPSRRLYQEGGYEVDYSMVYYGKPSRLGVETEDRVAGEVMRQVPREFYSEATRAILPDPVGKERALETIRVAAGFEVELVASEPLVEDPVDIAWGGDGRLWVVEMADYPLGIEGEPGGRVRFLEDEDGDGTWDRSTLFLDGLPYPNAVLPWRDGVLVVCANEVLMARDTDGDGVADEREPVLTGFESGNAQHQLGGLQWGLDGWVHVANGGARSTIRSVKTGRTIELGSRDLRFHPDTGAIDARTGRTQFGLARDDWGNWFGCSNSYPWWHFALDDTYLRRNPHVSYPSPRVLLGEQNPAPPVFPISRTVSRFNDYDAANRFTSACGVSPYRDRALGEIAARSLFTAEPVHNLVSRLELIPEGTTFSGKRVASEADSEFFASTDNWCRPTAVRTGPDGALYIVDMYRQVIEHPEWIPEPWQWRLNLRAGSDRGRIYRILPEESETRSAIDLTGLSPDELVAALDTGNGTVRDLVHQWILWSGDSAMIPGLRKLARTASVPAARVQALAALAGLGGIDEATVKGALRDGHPGVRRHGIRLSEPFLEKEDSGVLEAVVPLAGDDDPLVRQQLAYSLGRSKSGEAATALVRLMDDGGGDSYLRAAILSSLPGHAAEIADRLEEGLIRVHPELGNGLVQTLVGGRDPGEILRLLDDLSGGGGEPGDDGAAGIELVALTLSEMRKRGISLEALGEAGDVSSLENWLGEVRERARRSDVPPNERRAAIGLLGTFGGDRKNDRAQLLSLLSPREPLEIQLAAIRRMIEVGDDSLAEAILGKWGDLGAAVGKEAMNGLVTRGSWTPHLLGAIRENPVLARSLDASQRAFLLNHRNEALRRHAETVLAPDGGSSGDAKMETFSEALSLEGEGERGREHFEKRCATCHRIGETGFHVGPDLAALTNRSREALLRAIVDPNRAVEGKYHMVVATLRDGRSFPGVVASEAGGTIRLVNTGGVEETVRRDELKSITNTGLSLMPEGLEAGLEPGDMADLIAFLHGAAGSNRRIPARSDGSLLLPAGAGRGEGGSVAFDSVHRSLSWIGEGDAVEWETEGLAPGRYAIFFYAGLDGEEAATPSAFELTLGDRIIHGTIERTGRLDRLRKRQYGEVTLDEETGPLTVRFRNRFPGGRVSIREIVLIPMR